MNWIRGPSEKYLNDIKCANEKTKREEQEKIDKKGQDLIRDLKHSYEELGRECIEYEVYTDSNQGSVECVLFGDALRQLTKQYGAHINFTEKRSYELKTFCVCYKE